VDRKLQKLLSEVRTDLDSFTEVEAYALMASGYLMADNQLQHLDEQHKASGLAGTWGGFDIVAQRSEGWPFGPLLPLIGDDPAGSDCRARDLAIQLKVSSELFGKVWKLVPWLRTTAIVLLIALLIAASYWVYKNWEQVYTLAVELSVAKIIIGIGLLALTVLFPMTRYIRLRSASQSALFMIFVATLGWVAMNLHLLLFDPLFKRRGKLDRLLNLPAK